VIYCQSSAFLGAPCSRTSASFLFDKTSLSYFFFSSHLNSTRKETSPTIFLTEERIFLLSTGFPLLVVLSAITLPPFAPSPLLKKFIAWIRDSKIAVFFFACFPSRSCFRRSRFFKTTALLALLFYGRSSLTPRLSFFFG